MASPDGAVPPVANAGVGGPPGGSHRVNGAGGPASASGAAGSNSGEYIDLHEVAKGWKAAISRAKDPATRYVL